MKRQPKAYLGFDIGATSGRAILGELGGGQLQLREIHRFANQPVELGGTLYWNFLALWSEVLEGLRKCRESHGGSLDGIGIDTWGVGFGLLGRDGRLISNPVHYRDSLTEGVEQRILDRMTAEELYRVTGLPVGRVTVLAQLASMRDTEARHGLSATGRFLMISDLFRYFLCGAMACELTAASCSQLLDVRRGTWSKKIFSAFKLPTGMLPALVPPATVAGVLESKVKTQTGLDSVPIIAVAGHDTASAAVAMPVCDENTVFLSVGTWSVLGIARQQALLSPEALKCDFVNEFGFQSVLLVKNLMGLYLLENLRRARSQQTKQPQQHEDILALADKAKPFRFVLDLNSPQFFAAEKRVEESARNFLCATGQKGSPNQGELARSILEGLAFSYRQTLEELQTLTGKSYKQVCLVGGGSRNPLLCHFTANATGLEVLAGPAEATVIGNIGLQALATGELARSSDITELVAQAFPPVRYCPQDHSSWDKAFKHYRVLSGRVLSAASGSMP